LLRKLFKSAQFGIGDIKPFTRVEGVDRFLLLPAMAQGTHRNVQFRRRFLSFFFKLGFSLFQQNFIFKLAADCLIHARHPLLLLLVFSPLKSRLFGFLLWYVRSLDLRNLVISQIDIGGRILTISRSCQVGVLLIVVVLEPFDVVPGKNVDEGL
jgi:hypothetical protein